MKKGIIITIIMLSAVFDLKAQWLTSGSNIYNTNTGNVGIGTSSPGDPIEIYNSKAVIEYNRAGSYVWEAGVGDGTKIPLSFFAIRDVSDNAVRFVVAHTTGNVGIGTTIPTEKLTIGQSLPSGYSSMLSLNELSNNGSNSMGIDFKFDGLAGFPWGSTGRIEVARQSTSSNFDMLFHTATSGVLSEKMRILNNGNVGIGTSAPQAKLDVNGNIYSNGKIFIGTPDANTATQIANYSLAVNGNAVFNKAKVSLYGNWPDYVFSPSYKLTSVDSLEEFIKQNGHLPEVPNAQEVAKNGIDLGENQALLLKKIEELTLIVIEQNERIKEQNERIEKLEKKDTGSVKN